MPTEREVDLLAGVRVVDMTDGKGESCGRLFADLGADVVLVEPPGGATARREGPFVDGVGTYFATRNAGKRGLVLDLTEPADRARLTNLLDEADIWVESTAPGVLEQHGLDPARVARRNPALVITSITDFGRTGPYRDRLGGEWIHAALGGVLARSGLPGHPPLPPPGRLAGETASAQAAWMTLAAYLARLGSGQGEHLDVSVFESVVRVFDPGFGIGGSVLGGVPADELPPGRPDAAHLYPIFECRDGQVRVAILAARQWRAMRAWLGEPAALADPGLDGVRERHAHASVVLPRIAELFRDATVDELVDEGRRRGVPVAAVLTPGEVLACEHFRVRGAFTDTEIAPGVSGSLVEGCVEVDGARARARGPAPWPSPYGVETGGERATEWATRPRGTPTGPAPGGPAPAGPARPLAGLKVLDFGVIIAGAETGRLFADYGADVVKVESNGFIDGSRLEPDGMNRSFARGNRNKRGIGLDLRSPDGLATAKRLVAEADLVLANFKPGTLDKLGLGPDELRALNPELVVAESSAFGATGPWHARMGYGPLVRASSGLTALWRYPDLPRGYCDTLTAHPDHVVARYVVGAALAALIARRRTGRAHHVRVAQAEVLLTGIAEFVLAESRLERVTTGGGHDDDAPAGVYPGRGEDAWCVVTVAGDEHWRRLCTVLDRPDLLADPRLRSAPGRVAARAELDAELGSWLAARDPASAAAELVGAGVPAAAMASVAALHDDPELIARGFLTELGQPEFEEPVAVEARSATAARMADPAQRPAPRVGQDSRAVLADWLGMPDTETEALIRAGAVEVPPG